MLIGVPKEIKNNEFRVGLTPSSVNDYIHAGHHVLVEQGAGLGSGFSDQEYIVAGAGIVAEAQNVWGWQLVVMVMRHIAREYVYFREDSMRDP